jgi:hypothetical protein
MSKLPVIIIVLALVVLIGGAVFLAGWNIPAPSAVVEKTIPDGRFPN